MNSVDVGGHIPVGEPHEHSQLNRASLDHCVKCTICETQCPVAKVSPLFPGPKFVGPQAERFRDGDSVDASLDYCSGCGICTQACPQGVQIAELNIMAKAVMKEGHVSLRDQMISRTTLMGQLMTPFASIANAALELRPVRALMEKTIGVAAGAPMPQAQPQSLQTWLKKRPKPATPTRETVVYFTGCAGNWFEVEAGKKAIEVLEHLGYGVLVPRQGCCGLAQQSNGLFDQARSSVLDLCDDLIKGGRELTIVSSSGSCTGMLKHEAHSILGVDDPRLADVGTRIREISEFLLEQVDSGDLVLDLREVRATIPYHQPCQVKAQGMGMPALELMEMVPGIKVVESGQPCCGIAGTYGLKKEKFAIAQAVGKPVFDLVKAINPALATCDTETCRWQIEQGSGVRTVHPVEVLHHALGLADDLPLG